MNDKTFIAILTIFLAVILYAISWGLFVGIVWLICLCFGKEFSLLVATGIWLVILLIRWCFNRD